MILGRRLAETIPVLVAVERNTRNVVAFEKVLDLETVSYIASGGERS
jgi:hypothetical protein